MLASFLWITDYMKGKTAKEQDAALEHWAEKNKTYLDRPARSQDRDRGRGKPSHRRGNSRRQAPRPRDVATVYCNRLAIPLDDLADHIDWSFFADCSRDEDLALLQGNEGDSDSDSDSSGSDSD